MAETSEGLASIQTLDRRAINPLWPANIVLDMLRSSAQNNADEYRNDVYGTSEPNLKGDRNSQARQKRGHWEADRQYELDFAVLGSSSFLISAFPLSLENTHFLPVAI